MARKTKEEARKTRAGILNAALDLIYEKGYSATNLNDIATRLGMTRGAVYWHFKNKEDLFFSLIEEIETEIDQILEEHAHGVQTIVDLAGFLNSLAELYITDERMFKYLIVLSIKIEWNDELDRVVKLFRKQSHKLETFFLHILKRAEKKGDLRPGIDKKITSKSLAAVLEGLLFSVIPPFGERNTTIINNGLQIFFQGITRQ